MASSGRGGPVDMGNIRRLRCALWLVVLASTIVLALFSPSQAAAQAGTRVGLVIDTGTGDPITMIVTVAEANPTGYRILQASDLDIVAQSSGLGVAICSIEGIGCPASRCFCESPAHSWTYWHLVDGVWVYSPVGASTYRVSNGSVEAWRWGPGDPPALITFDEIAAAANGELSSGEAGSQQAYPGPEPATPDPDGSFDPYPAPDATAPAWEAYPGPDEPATAETPASASTPAILAPIATMETPSGPAPTQEEIPPTFTPISLGAATPERELLQVETRATGEPSTGLNEDQVAAPSTPDRVAALISTAVARHLDAAAAGDEPAEHSTSRSYVGFGVLLLLLLGLVGYVYLLRRQRRADRARHG